MSEKAGAPAPKPGVLDIQLYVPGRSEANSSGPIYKLSSNESPIGASALAVEAYQKNAAEMADYPDGGATDLREALAAKYGLDYRRIVCSNGSDELISLLSHGYLGPGTEAVYSQYGFLMYRIAILASGGTPVVAPERDEKADVDAILGCVTDRTRLVFLANPNNPTGTFLPNAEVRRLHAGLPKNVILVLDAAYAEYIRRNDYEAGIELVSTSDNVVMTRTFSKAYGMANLRIGWAYCPQAIADVLHRVRGPFNVSGPAIAAGVAAIQDQAHLDKAVAHNDKWLPRLTEALSGLGLRVTPSVGNFLLLHFPDEDGKRAEDADEFLMERGLIMRRVGVYGFPNALRMSVGSDEANELVIQALGEFLA